MNETTGRRILLAVAVVGLFAGLAVQHLPIASLQPAIIWTVATLPVIATLGLSILRDLLIGRLGVDAIALASMSVALVLGEALAAVVVAIMYAGGTVLEDAARGRAERDLTALTDRSPRLAHRRTGQEFETSQSSAWRWVTSFWFEPASFCLSTVRFRTPQRCSTNWLSLESPWPKSASRVKRCAAAQSTPGKHF